MATPLKEQSRGRAALVFPEGLFHKAPNSLWPSWIRRRLVGDPTIYPTEQVALEPRADEGTRHLCAGVSCFRVITS
jgi:hypothetical protein